TAQLAPEFEKRNVKPLGLSTDTVEAHKGWIEDVNDTQSTVLEFPIVADKERKVAELYDMIHPNESATATVRSVFIIDPNQKVRLIMTYPMTVGRNFNEILRVIDALQTTDREEVACPADWVPGDSVIIRPTVSDEDAKQKFPQGWKTLRPYLRLTDIK
ncbi:redoxin domain-containing protein, partial [Idiomarina sp.]